MSGHRHDVERKITLPAGMELVVPPPAPEDIADEAWHGASAVPGERATSPAPTERGETRRARDG